MNVNTTLNLWSKASDADKIKEDFSLSDFSASKINESGEKLLWKSLCNDEESIEKAVSRSLTILLDMWDKLSKPVKKSVRANLGISLWSDEAQLGFEFPNSLVILLEKLGLGLEFSTISLGKVTDENGKESHYLHELTD